MIKILTEATGSAEGGKRGLSGGKISLRWDRGCLWLCRAVKESTDTKLGEISRLTSYDIMRLILRMNADKNEKRSQD